LRSTAPPSSPLVVDRERLASLFEEHAAFVARTLRRLGVPDADIEDALQDVFMVAQSKLDVIEAGKEQGFLFAITRSRASSVRRSISRTIRRIDLAREGEERVESAPDSGDRAEKEHARTILDKVLDELTVDLRTVLVLHELEELELTAIAELLEVPVGTVTSRLRRAREKFEVQAARVRALLAADDDGPGHER
jgi:RNA polymerase sigma-70 factor (ECF subfamily)